MATEFKPKRRADKDVVAYAEFSGLRNDIAPERFDATDLVTANNVDLDKSRRISRRTGATIRSLLPAHSLWAEGDRALFISGTSLYSLSAALVPTLIRTDMSGQPVSFCRINDEVFLTDRVTPMVALGSTTRSWGLDVPPPLLVTPTAGNLSAGRYGVTATYLRSDGQESGAEASTPFSVSAGQGALLTVLPSLDPGVVSKRVYMTAPDGEILYHVATLANATLTYSPSAANVAAANEPLATQFMGAPPAGQLIAYYKGRMFVAVGNVLYPSEPFAYELFDQRNYIEFDGDITMLAPMEDKAGEASGFFIGTNKTCGVLVGGGPEEFKYIPKTEYGAIHGALDFVDGALYLDGSLGARMLPMWLTTQGLCVGLPNLEIRNLTRSRFTFAATGVGAALFIPKENRFVAVSDANPAVVLHVENQTLTTYTNYAYNSLASFADKLLGANAAGLFELAGDSDNGLPISGTVTLGTTDFGSTFQKSIDRLYVGYCSRADMVLRVTTEGKEQNYYTLPVTNDTELASQRVKLGKGLSARYWQFTLQNLDGTYFELDTVDVRMAILERRINGRT